MNHTDFSIKYSRSFAKILHGFPSQLVIVSNLHHPVSPSKNAASSIHYLGGIRVFRVQSGLKGFIEPLGSQGSFLGHGDNLNFCRHHRKGNTLPFLSFHPGQDGIQGLLLGRCGYQAKIRRFFAFFRHFTPLNSVGIDHNAAFFFLPVDFLEIEYRYSLTLDKVLQHIPRPHWGKLVGISH